MALERLVALGERALFVRGNGDREIAAPPAPQHDLWAERTRWSASSSRAGSGPGWRRCRTQTVAVDELGPVLFCHGSPRSDEEILTISPEERVAASLRVEEPVVVCGHTHVQFDRRVAGKRLVNAGSVGMPYEAGPGAYWALLGPDVELRRTDYDLEAAAAAIRATGFPAAQELAEENVLTVPTPEEATEQFEGRRPRRLAAECEEGDGLDVRACAGTCPPGARSRR